MKAEFYFVCTFCGYYGSIVEYLILLRSGLYSRKQYKCPDCENVMYRDTLMTRMTNKYWGAWVSVNIRLYGHKFNNRIKWEKLKKRINSYGIAREFWEGFNFIKNNYERLSDKQREDLSILKYKPETTQTTLLERIKK